MRRSWLFFLSCFMIIGACTILIAVGIGIIGECRAAMTMEEKEVEETVPEQSFSHMEEIASAIDSEDIPQRLRDLEQRNSETKSFVEGYPDRDAYLYGEISIDADCAEGEMPLLLQWDKRWGYRLFAGEEMALSGCGPTCLSMVLVYLTGDTSMNPYQVAQWADQNGYGIDGQGSSWTLMSDGAAELGLEVEELPLWEGNITQALDQDHPVICCMGPGDFTATGHFIVLYDYDQHGFFVKDPNSRKNSSIQWSYDCLEGQIRNLWSFQRAE
jgi:hypothetical protein